MLASLNHDILFAISAVVHWNPLLEDLAVFFAEWFPFLVIGSVIVYELFAQDKDHEIVPSIVRTLLPSLIAWFAASLIKFTHPAGRPFAGNLDITPLVTVPDPFGSFPSAHAMVFGALAGAMLGNRFHAWRWYLLSAVIIAVARVAVGVHFPTDVIVGLAVGFLLGFLIARPLQMMKKEPKKD